ncbi:hypothetical protein ABZP36_033118 [Zizania latifolia]
MAELVGPRLYSCCHCRNHVCLHDDIISKAFQESMGASMKLGAKPDAFKRQGQEACLKKDSECSILYVIDSKYVKPHDHEKLSQVELLVIDEADAIPLLIVKSLLGPNLVFLSSTVNDNYLCQYLLFWRSRHKSFEDCYELAKRTTSKDTNTGRAQHAAVEASSPISVGAAAGRESTRDPGRRAEDLVRVQNHTLQRMSRLEAPQLTRVKMIAAGGRQLLQAGGGRRAAQGPATPAREEIRREVLSLHRPGGYGK